jgi:hypothetical protein
MNVNQQALDKSRNTIPARKKYRKWARKQVLQSAKQWKTQHRLANQG